MKIIAMDEPIISFQGYPKALLDYAIEHGANPAILLDSADLTKKTYNDFQAQISYLQYKQLINTSMELLNDPALGLHFGEKLGFHGHGLIGFAAMACRNIEEGIQTAIRFKKLISPITQVAFKRLPQLAQIICMPAFEGGDEQRFFVEVLFATMTHSLNYNLPDTPTKINFEFSYSEPNCITAYHRILGPHCSFDRPQNRSLFSNDILDMPLKYANPAIIHDAKQNAYPILSRLEQQAGLLEALRAYINSKLPEYPSIDDIAQHFNVSRSTLKRRLQAHNTSYKIIIDEIKMNKACELLEISKLSIDEISSHLYFSEGAAFRRAFKRCCGISPSEYRKQSSLRLVI